ncbi:MAG: WbqC family protein [Candidatus Omnitrophica bacterium]|nr:WbqC family protein [Candidatus Omnitrophota bacterium]
MIISIHQPEHLPWMGLISKIYHVDVFVLLDTVQYRKNYFQNRNRICYRDKYKWITVPVKKTGLHTLIKDVLIDNAQPWRQKYLKLLYNSYCKTPFFKQFKDNLWEIYLRPCVYLSELNIALIKYILKVLEIDTQIFIASEFVLPVVGGGTQVVLNICKYLEAESYLSGSFGKDYLDENILLQSGVKVRYQDFKHPIYLQAQSPFMPSLSIIDTLFNCGAQKTKELIKESIPDEIFI